MHNKNKNTFFFPEIWTPYPFLEVVLQLHGLGLQSLPLMVVKWGMDPNGYRVISTYTMENGVAKYGNNGRKSV